MAVVTVTIQVEDSAGPTPLDGVRVQIFDAAGTTFLAEDTTGSPFATGDAEFSLFGDGGGVTYTVRLSLDGWRFPAGATQQFVVFDPPAPSNTFGPFGALVGPSALLVTLAVEDDQMVPQPIESVDMFVYTALDAFITQITTDVLGEAVLPLVGSVSPGTTYIVRPSKEGVIFPNSAQTIMVEDPLVPPNTNIFDFVGTVFTPPQSLDADMCMVSGIFTNQSLSPAARLVLEFKPIPFFVTVGRGEVRKSSLLIGGFTGEPTLLRSNILTRSVKVTTGADGRFQVLLPRTGCFEVHIHGFEDPIEITERIFVPDAASADFLDLLYPFVASVTYGTDPINLAVGESAVVDIVVTLSNTQTVERQDFLADLLEFSVGDDTIASVSLFSGTAITVQGTQAGSTTVEVARVDELVVPSRPPVAALVVTPPVVNIS